MKVNKIHQELKELYKGKSDVFDTLGIQFNIDDEKTRIINLFDKGYWSIAPLAFNAFEEYSIRLTPLKRITDSCINVNSGYSSNIFSS